MIGWCLDWTSLRSLIVQVVIDHKSSRPNTVNLSFPYHLSWSFIQITIIQSSWSVLVGWTLWQDRDEGASIDIIYSAQTLWKTLGISRSKIDMNLRFNVIGWVINEKLCSSHHLCWGKLGKLYFRNSHLSRMIEEMWGLASKALSHRNENKNCILFVKPIRSPPQIEDRWETPTLTFRAKLKEIRIKCTIKTQCEAEMPPVGPSFLFGPRVGQWTRQQEESAR